MKTTKEIQYLRPTIVFQLLNKSSNSQLMSNLTFTKNNFFILNFQHLQNIKVFSCFFSLFRFKCLPSPKNLSIYD